MEDRDLEFARLLDIGDLKAVVRFIEGIPGAVTKPLPVSGHRLINWREARAHHVPKLTIKLRAAIYAALNEAPAVPFSPPRPARRRLNTFSAQAGLCYYCGKLTAFSKWTIDHLQPRSRGGSNEVANLKGACQTCNTDKADRTESEYRQLRGLD